MTLKAYTINNWHRREGIVE